MRYRVDGMLRRAVDVPITAHAEVVSHIKILAQMDISEKRMPQDGHISLRHENREYDLRVSSLPAVGGEKIVLRVLDKNAMRWSLGRGGDFSRGQPQVPGIGREPVWDAAVDRSDRQRQDDDSLLRAGIGQHAPEEHRDGRGPGRVSSAGDHAGAGQAGRRRDVCLLAAEHPPAGPGHHSDRRNPRPGDGGDRDQCRVDGASGSEHAAHERCGGGRVASDQYRYSAVSGCFGPAGGRGPAAGANGLSPVPGGV